MVRGPFFRIAHRNVPTLSLSSSDVTYNTLPPLPPVVYIPAPSAPGKAGVCANATIEIKEIKRDEIRVRIVVYFIIFEENFVLSASVDFTI